MAAYGKSGRLIAVIGDQDTCTGFLLGGVGEVNAKRQKNFFVVSKDTTIHEIEEKFQSFVARNDIAIILITQKVNIVDQNHVYTISDSNEFDIAEEIRHVLDGHTLAIPAVLEIPSKDYPYDASKDSILKRAKGMFSAEDFR